MVRGHQPDRRLRGLDLRRGPRLGPGETTITFQYFVIPAVSNEAGTAHDGTTTLPTTPTENFVFGRKVGCR